MGVNLQTIARHCGVDASTVSRALRGDLRVKEDTRTKILTASESLGYRPNLAARYLKTGKTRTVWFIIPSLHNSLERELAEHASESLREEGYDLLVALFHRDPESHRRLLDRLYRGIADAALIVPGQKMNLTELTRLQNIAFPLVFLDRHYEEMPIPVVTSANAEAAAELVRRCMKEGMEEFVLLFQQDNPAGRARLNGAVTELQAAGIPYQILSTETADEARFHIRTGKVGILSSSQVQIRELVAARRDLFQSARLVFGVFDGWQGEPAPASCVHVCMQDFKSMASAAVRMLIRKINDPQVALPPFTTVPPLEFLRIASLF